MVWYYFMIAFFQNPVKFHVSISMFPLITMPTSLTSVHPLRRPKPTFTPNEASVASLHTHKAFHFSPSTNTNNGRPLRLRRRGPPGSLPKEHPRARFSPMDLRGRERRCGEDHHELLFGDAACQASKEGA